MTFRITSKSLHNVIGATARVRNNPAPPGGIEPHAGLLTVPPADELLYKVMTIENLLCSIQSTYLYFNRVDRYSDFPGADPHDGQQLPADLPGNAASTFLKAPYFSAADYYDRCRARTYACCFALENSDTIWNIYGNGGEQGKVSLVFEFEKLRARLNRSVSPDYALLLYDGVPCTQIFSVNYGIVKYVDWDRDQANQAHLINPIEYTYAKATRFRAEKELRVALSAPGVGQFSLDGGRTLTFPASLCVEFDFRAAIAEGTVKQILCAPEGNTALLHSELEKLGIGPAPGSDPTARA